MKILILGAGGQLGALLAASAPPHLQVFSAHSSVANICDREQLAAKIAHVAPDVIINAAAYTQVDKAETEPELAFAVNHLGVRNIIDATSSATRIIHISTDFVFDGTATVFAGTATIPYPPDARANPLSVYGRSKLAGEQELLDGTATIPYPPDARVNPLSVYGRSKLAGEQELLDKTATIPYPPDARANPLSVYGRSKLAGEQELLDGTATIPYPPDARVNPLSVYGRSKLAGEQELLANAAQRSCIVRTAWLYAATGKNFVNTMLTLMASRDQLNVVNDQIGTPTSAHSLAAAIWRFVERPQLHGIFHWTDAGEASWYDFAREIQRLGLAYGLLHREIPISPIPTSAYPTPAHRPAYSVLDKQSTWAALNTTGVPWQQELDKVMKIKAAQQDKS